MDAGRCRCRCRARPHAAPGHHTGARGTIRTREAPRERGSLGSRASRPQVGRRPTGVQAGKMPALPGLRHRASWKPPGSAGVSPASGPKAHRCSSGQDARALRAPTPGLVEAAWERGRLARKWAEGPQVFKRARCPRSQGSDTGPRGSRLGARASRPQVGRRPTGVQAGKMPALPGLRHRASWKPPGSAGVSPASGPKAHRCSSGQDARAPRAPTPGLVEAAWERGRLARKWAEGPQVFKRARCPRSQGSDTGPRGSPLGSRASRPQVGRRPTGVQAGKMPALSGLRHRASWKPPGSAGVPPASGPKAHRCSSGQDARAPRDGDAAPCACRRTGTG